MTYFIQPSSWVRCTRVWLFIIIASNDCINVVVEILCFPGSCRQIAMIKNRFQNRIIFHKSLMKNVAIRENGDEWSIWFHLTTNKYLEQDTVNCSNVSWNNKILQINLYFVFSIFFELQPIFHLAQYVNCKCVRIKNLFTGWIMYYCRILVLQIVKNILSWKKCRSLFIQCVFHKLIRCSYISTAWCIFCIQHFHSYERLEQWLN